MATTMLESTPPLMYDTTGTSARSRRFTASSKSASNSSESRRQTVDGIHLPNQEKSSTTSRSGPRPPGRFAIRPPELDGEVVAGH